MVYFLFYHIISFLDRADLWCNLKPLYKQSENVCGKLDERCSRLRGHRCGRHPETEAAPSRRIFNAVTISLLPSCSLLTHTVFVYAMNNNKPVNLNVLFTYLPIYKYGEGCKYREGCLILQNLF